MYKLEDKPMNFRVWLTDGTIVYGQAILDLYMDYVFRIVRVDMKNNGRWIKTQLW